MAVHKVPGTEAGPFPPLESPWHTLADPAPKAPRADTKVKTGIPKEQLTALPRIPSLEDEGLW